MNIDFLIGNNAPVLGRGSSRIVYRIGQGKVLKLKRRDSKARPWLFAEDQNKKEQRISSDKDCSAGFPVVYEWASDFTWLISQEAKGFRTNAQLKKFCGMNVYELYRAVSFGIDDRFLQTITGLPVISKETKQSVNAVRLAVRKHGLRRNALDIVKHWGRIGNRLVVLDYGW